MIARTGLNSLFGADKPRDNCGIGLGLSTAARSLLRNFAGLGNVPVAGYRVDAKSDAT